MRSFCTLQETVRNDVCVIIYLGTWKRKWPVSYHSITRVRWEINTGRRKGKIESTYVCVVGAGLMLKSDWQWFNEQKDNRTGNIVEQNEMEQ